ncbi:hypothetical protein ABXT08_07065 [Chryseobacterium sp. NRRL B-14859]|uniref:hypothetical protein n=1 Tax=Chryseobacterium sp. NRRL B-14859 TaxID=1562763 RepID=UPI0033983BD5
MDITKELSIEECNHILDKLFGFEFVNVSDYNEQPHFILYDSEGEEFYGKNENLQFDLTTLQGIFLYHAYVHKQNGYWDAQSAMRQAIGLNH